MLSSKAVDVLHLLQVRLDHQVRAPNPFIYLFTLGIFAILYFYPIPTHAIPFHTHGDPFTTFELDGDRGVREVHDHVGVITEAGDTPHQHYNTLNFGGNNNPREPWSAFGAWNDERFFFDRTDPFDGPYPSIPHGFIDESARNTRRDRTVAGEKDHIPDYFFVNPQQFDQNAIDLIDVAFQRWSALNAGRSPVSGLGLRTGLEFERTLVQANAEILVMWENIPPLGRTNPFVARLTVAFDSNPDREDTPVVEQWFFGVDPAGTPANQFHFFSTALHEIGHVVGLDEQDDRDDVMIRGRDTGSGPAPAGPAFAGIDPDSMEGAFVLYSIPCTIPLAPAPESRNQISQITPGDICKDFGDAPDSFYRTLLISDGPRYQEGTLQRLGDLWDGERDGQPTPRADGDDLSILGECLVCLDDEDGVVFGRDFVDVTWNINRPGLNTYLLRAWSDLDDSGCFNHLTDPGCGGNELLIHDMRTLDEGVYTFRYPFNPFHYSRFRFTWVDDPSGWFEIDHADMSRGITTDIKPFFEYISIRDGISHGEVEDYPPVPEPSTWLMFSTGLLGILGYAWRRKKRVV